MTSSKSRHFENGVIGKPSSRVKQNCHFNTDATTGPKVGRITQRNTGNIKRLPETLYGTFTESVKIASLSTPPFGALGTLSAFLTMHFSRGLCANLEKTSLIGTEVGGVPRSLPESSLKKVRLV